MRRDPIRFFSGLAHTYGDFVRFDVGGGDFFLVNHPDLIREVLITQDRAFTRWYAVDVKSVLGNGLFVSEGSFYTRQRRLSQPAFHRQRIAGYAETMVRTAERVMDRWTDGQRADIAQEMNWMAMIIVAETLFGADVEADTIAVRDALGEVLAYFQRSMIPPSDQAEFDQARSRMDQVIYRIIRERRGAAADGRDLLSLLLQARDEEGDGSGMTDLQVRDELMNIFLAGHESTANALTWTWYLLSQNPDAETRLHREVDEILGGRRPRMEDAGQLSYTGMVFSEALRLYPPLWSIARQAIGEVEIGGYTIPAGSVIILSQYVTQRDQRFFPDPDRFDPLRWTPEEQAARPKYCYFPFSAGSRQCIGEPFAWMEGVLCLATLAQRWRMKLAPGHRVALQPALTLRAKNGMLMDLYER